MTDTGFLHATHHGTPVTRPGGDMADRRRLARSFVLRSIVQRRQLAGSLKSSLSKRVASCCTADAISLPTVTGGPIDTRSGTSSSGRDVQHGKSGARLTAARTTVPGDIVV